MNILYEDESIIVIDKPSKMMVYPTLLAKNCHWFATKELLKLGYKNIHTIHRLDRPTSGVLMFAKNKEMAKDLSLLFKNGKVQKTYNCLVRGHCNEKGSIENALKKDGDGILQEAKTKYRTLQYYELEKSINRYPKSRFSYLEIEPITGRMHQIRRHLSHLRNPIIGDKRYGDRHYNRFFKENYELENLMLHAKSISFLHPRLNQVIEIEAELPTHFTYLLSLLPTIKNPTPLPDLD